MQLPDARTLSRWQRHVVMYRLGVSSFEEGLELFDQVSHVSYRVYPDKAHFPELYFTLERVREDFRLYSNTVTWWFWAKMCDWKCNWYKGIDNWQKYFRALEWHFRPRIAEED